MKIEVSEEKSKEITPAMVSFAGIAVAQFAENCAEMASKHWCTDHCKMLDRLFVAVMQDEEYAPAPDPEE